MISFWWRGLAPEQHGRVMQEQPPSEPSFELNWGWLGGAAALGVIT